VCDSRRWSWFIHRELVLLAVLVAVTLTAFFVTRAVASGNSALRRTQAAAWFDLAERASQNQDRQAAVLGLRRAVSKDPENTRYRLALAATLASNHLDDEATRVLLALREVDPEDPETNLQLARLASRRSDVDATRRYYQNALAGLWRPEQSDRRRRIRTELIDMLLAHQERARALSELLLLSPNLPDDPGVLVHVGQLADAAGDPRLALEQYARAVRLDARNADALAGAGEAAFELADYASALRYFDAIPQQTAKAAELRDIARLVLTADPLAPRLALSERRTRIAVAFHQAVHRLNACSSAPADSTNDKLERLRNEAQAFEEALDLRRRAEPRDIANDGADLVYRIERAVEGACALPPAPLDRALLLIGRRHGFEEQ
jgi:tetratricopeptide (TPR) repeat protein